MNKTLLVTIFIFPIIFTVYFLAGNVTNDIYHNIDDDIFTSLTDLTKKGSTFTNTILWRYNASYTKRFYVSGTSDSPSSFLPAPIEGNRQYQRMLLYHKQNLCYLTRVVDMEESSLLKGIIAKRDDTTNPNLFYISCPIYKGKVLYGYISSVFTNDSNAVIIYVSRMELLKSLIEVYI